jgi:hypothetical protein
MVAGARRKPLEAGRISTAGARAEAVILAVTRAANIATEAAGGSFTSMTELLTAQETMTRRHADRADQLQVLPLSYRRPHLLLSIRRR